MEVEEQIRANADLVIESLGPTSGIGSFGYNAESVKWLDGFVERQRVRPELGADAIAKLTSTLGSFLGECVIACYGGEWRFSDGNWGVAFDPKNSAFPFNKIRKQFDNGSEDSIYGWFEIIPELFSKHVKNGLPPER